MFLAGFEIVHYLALATITPARGTIGTVPSRKNTTITPMSTEPTPPAANPNLSILSVYIDDPIGQSFALLVSTVAAAESAIGLAILVVYSRMRGTISAQYTHSIKG